MNIHRPSNIKKYILVTVAVLVLVGLGYYWYLSQNNPNVQDLSDSIDYGAPSQEVIDAGKEAKSNTVKNDQGKKIDQKTTGSNSTSNAPFTLDITTALTENDEKLRVGSIVGGLHSQGTCKLTLNKGSQVITRTSDIQPLTDYTSCTGFDVALTSGTWQVILQVTIDDKTVSKSTTVEVP